MIAPSLDSLKSDIISRLGIEGIRDAYASLGVDFTGNRVSSSGALECYAFGREIRGQSTPSACVFVESGRYNDSADGSKNCSFWDFQLAHGKFGADFKAVLEHFAQRVGVDIPARGKTKQSKSAGELVKTHNEEITKRFLIGWRAAKPGVDFNSALRAGVRSCRWRSAHGDELTCIRFEAFDPANWVTPCGTIIYRQDGKAFFSGTVSERKTQTLAGSKDGLVIIGSQEDLAAAETVWKLEGLTDALAIAPHLPPGHVAVANLCGAGSFPARFAPAFNGKRVIICHDADTAGEKGIAAVGSKLAGHAASIWQARLPYDVQDKHGKDLRDWLNEGNSFSALGDLLIQIDPNQLPQPDEKSKKEGESEESLVKTVSDLIEQVEHFAQDPSGKLYVFQGGAYRPGGENRIKQLVQTLVILHDETKRWNQRFASDVVEWIRLRSSRLWEQPLPDVINLTNGLLRVSDRKLLPHSPAHLSTIQLPVKYDPAADCPAIDKFVSDVFPADAVGLAWELAAWLMLPNLGIQKSVLLLGEGANGKSRFLKLLTTFLGRDNTAAVSLHKLEADRFAAAGLYGKLANIAADLPSSHLEGTSTFKTITGGDPLTVERKFGQPFEFTPFCRMIFSANFPPRSPDSSHAFFRRWLAVPFDRTFSADEQIAPDVLDARLAAPAELSGLLNCALDALPGLVARRDFGDAASLRNAWQDFRGTTDPLATWLEKNTIDGPDFIVEKGALRTAYNADCERAGRPIMSNKSFGTAITRLRPDVTDVQRGSRGSQKWYYLGIGLLSENQKDEFADTADCHNGTRVNSVNAIGLFNRTEDQAGITSGEEGNSNALDATKYGDRVDGVYGVYGEKTAGEGCNHQDPSKWIARGDGVHCPGCGKWLARSPAASSPAAPVAAAVAEN